MPRHDLSDLSDMDLARLLGAKGRNGDSLVAHINPQEASLLKALGGSGTRNPRTGLLEFSPMGGQAGGKDGTGIGGSEKGGRSNSGAGPAAAGAGQGHLGMGYGGGVGMDKRSTADAPQKGGYGKTAKGAAGGMVGVAPDSTQSGGTAEQSGAPFSGGSVADKDFFDRFAGGLFGGLGSTVGGTLGTLAGGPFGGILGTIGGAAAEAAFGGPSEKDNTKQDGTSGGPAGSGGSGGPGPGAGPGSESGAGMGYGGGVGIGGSGPGNIPGSLAAAARQAEIDRATATQPQNTGLIAALSPPVPGAMPALPAGLLQYLAQNPGLIQGLTNTSRFGTGSVAPLNYMRTYA